MSATSSSSYGMFSFALFSPLAVLYSVVSQIYLQVVRRPHVRELPPASLPAVAKVAIVTGCNTGIGYETAKELVITHSYTVIAACRSRTKAQEAIDKINLSAKHGRAVFVHPLDLSSLQSVKDFCGVVKQQFKYIDVLVCNAGRNTSGDITADGLDLLWQTNFVSHAVLSLQMQPQRLVMLSSVMHHFVNLEAMVEPESWRHIAGTKAYSTSKLASVLWANEWNRQFGDSAVAVNPGAVNSDIWRDLPTVLRRTVFEWIYLTNAQGCQTSLQGVLASSVPPLGMYWQPYWQPRQGVPFPVFEMLGPFAGPQCTPCRLPRNEKDVSASLWSFIRQAVAEFDVTTKCVHIS